MISYVLLTTTNIIILIFLQFIEHHILISSATKRGEFKTLSGRTVTVSGNDIITGNGFPIPVTSSILASPTIPVELPSTGANNETTTISANLKIYFLSRPLEGGIAAPSRIDELQSKNIRGYIGFLRSFPDSEPIFTELEKELKIIQYDLINRGDIPPAERIDNAAKDLNDVCLYITDELLNTDMLSTENEFELEQQKIQILQCLESWTTERLHDIILDVLRNQLKSDLTELRTNLDTNMNKTANDFSIKPIFQCNYTLVIEKFKELNKALTPLEKLHIIRDATLLVHKCVETSLENSNVDISDIEMGADDILPILAWILLSLQKESLAIINNTLSSSSSSTTTNNNTNTTTPPAGRTIRASSSLSSFASLTLGSSPRNTSTGAPTTPNAGNSTNVNNVPLLTSDLPLHLAFIQRFHLPGCGELELSLLGYRLANLEQALNYFRTRKSDKEDEENR